MADDFKSITTSKALSIPLFYTHSVMTHKFYMGKFQSMHRYSLLSLVK